MYTDPNHIKVSDPGSVEGNVVFAYLDAFHGDKEEVFELKNHYRNGGLGDTVIKKILNDTLQNLLAPIREKRAKISDEEVQAVLKTGTSKAYDIAEETIQKVRQSIGLRYY